MQIGIPRPIFLLSVGLLINGCDRLHSRQAIEAIEIGSTFARVVIKSTGEAQFFVDERTKTQKTGLFRIEPGEFVRIVERLDHYRSDAKPTSEAVETFVNVTCPKSVPQVTDQGMLFVRWVGVRYDRALFADLGCDYQRYEQRNRAVLGILDELQLPESSQSLP